ncbi:MAG: hypothetical protein ACI379_03915, partial [Nocardioides sp.]|uniref:hypothetical protein n=1 Tax=Nocardioides sp. TaxID=35761 RepID=UPI003F0D22ED
MNVFRSYRLAAETVVIVAILVLARWALWEIGVPGMDPSVLMSSIISGGVFVMGLVVAGTLSDYRDAERAPTDLATSLYAILRDSEAIHKVWGKPDMPRLCERLIAVVAALRADISNGSSREYQQAVEDLTDSLLEMEETDVPANYVVRIRSEQAALRKAALR